MTVKVREVEALAFRVPRSMRRPTTATGPKIPLKPAHFRSFPCIGQDCSSGKGALGRLVSSDRLYIASRAVEVRLQIISTAACLVRVSEWR